MLIIFIISFILIICIICVTNRKRLLEKNYYEIDETFPVLNNIHNNLDIFQSEVNNIVDDTLWLDWVEKNLYNKDWKIFPLCGFNIWVEDNCKKCPELTKFLKSIPNLKVAILSKLKAGTKLNEHRGWGNHSNHVLRCHFGFKIPKKCYISVGAKDTNNNIIREVKKYKKNKWIIFDDSRHHFTWNFGDDDRIVLILDIERPQNVKVGNSEVGDTKELTELINSFRNKFS